MLVNLLQACIDVLFFHHPAAWWISAQVRGEREHCADDLAVRVLESGGQGTRLSYARALVSLEEQRIATAFAMAADGGSLVDRIRRLSGVEAPQASAARLVAGALATACMVAVVAAGAAAPRPALAAEEQALPEDTNAITSLTPEEAENLAKEFPGVEAEVERGRKKWEGCLPLNGLTSLDAETAAALVGYGKRMMPLRDGSRGRPRLVLNGLTTLDADTAKALAGFDGDLLCLDGLTTLDADTATALAGFKSDHPLLYLNGVTTLDAETAKVLAGFKGYALCLDGLTTLDADTAKAIADSKVQSLRLNGLTTLDADTATAIAAFKGPLLFLNGVTTLDAETAKALAGFKGYSLGLDGLTTLDADTAKALAGFKVYPWLSLAGLTTLDAETVTAFAETANALAADKKRPVVLSGITAFDSPDSVAIAEALATYKGRLCLPNLKKISPKTLSALVAKEDVEIPLIETLELIAEPDGSPNDDFVIPEGFKELQERQERERQERQQLQKRQ
jgi:hypothetical protein